LILHPEVGYPAVLHGFLIHVNGRIVLSNTPLTSFPIHNHSSIRPYTTFAIDKSSLNEEP
jgi:hypothetical protein